MYPLLISLLYLFVLYWQIHFLNQLGYWIALPETKCTSSSKDPVGGKNNQKVSNSNNLLSPALILGRGSSIKQEIIKE